MIVRKSMVATKGMFSCSQDTSRFRVYWIYGTILTSLGSKRLVILQKGVSEDLAVDGDGGVAVDEFMKFALAVPERKMCIKDA